MVTPFILLLGSYVLANKGATRRTDPNAGATTEEGGRRKRKPPSRFESSDDEVGRPVKIKQNGQGEKRKPCT